MRQFLSVRGRGLAVVVGVATCAAAVWASDRKAADAKPTENKLIGTWRTVSAKFGGQEVVRPEGHTTLKHVTPTQFMWTTFDAEGQMSRAAGGSYTLKGEDYVETPEYGMSDDFQVIKGKAQKFTWKVEGNKWYHNGKLSNGLTIEEVWERVEKK